jgi:hypothetical protein
MRRLLVIASALAGLVLTFYLLYGAADRVYFSERRRLHNQINTATARLAEYQRARVDHRRVKDEIQAFVDRTLGGDGETVDSKLRSRLSRLVKQAGLHDESVDTNTVRAPRAKESPAKAEFSRSGFQLELREELDFIELDAWVNGSGTLEQCLKLIDAIDAEPWIKRIDQLVLDPIDNGSKFQLALRLTSLFLPKRTPNPDALVRTTTASNAQRYATLLSANPFRLPPPAQAAAAQVATPAPERFPFSQWFLTGIAQSAAGVEVWLLNQQSRETRVLNIGQRLDELTLVGVNAEAAVFLVGPDHVSVRVGRNLNDRQPLKQ